MVLQRKKRVDPVASSETTARDTDAFENTLRPKSLQEYIGQNHAKEHISVYIDAAKKRNEPLGHVLLHGPPGLGKTTLAYIIAHEMGSSIKLTSGPAIEKTGDLASLLTHLNEGDVLFIDEIHRMRPALEEVLYSAMEDFALDIVIGKGPTARSMRLDLKPFTLIGATTKIGSMSAPLRDRFVHTFKLEFYTQDDMTHIVNRTSKLLDVSLEEGAAKRIASSARATPRIANRLVRAVRDFAQVKEEHLISVTRVTTTMQSLGIDEQGLDRVDREILSTLIEKFSGSPVGLNTLAAALAEEEQTLEDVYEPYLLQCGFLKRTPKGRMATERAYELLGLSTPESLQKKLFS